MRIRLRGSDDEFVLFQNPKQELAAAARNITGFRHSSAPRSKPQAFRYRFKSRRSFSVFPRRLHFIGAHRMTLIFLPLLSPASGSNWISILHIHGRSRLRKGLAEPYCSSSISCRDLSSLNGTSNLCVRVPYGNPHGGHCP